MRTAFGLAVILAALATSPPVRANDLKNWLAEGKDELAKGDWDGDKKWDSKPSGGAAPTPAPPAPDPNGGGTSGGTPTPTPGTTGGGGDGSTTDGGGDDGATTGGGGDAHPSGGDDDEEKPEGAPGTPVGGGTPGPAPAPGGSPTPFPGPAPLPTCTSQWVQEGKQPAPALVEKETLLTITLFRTDAFAFVSNGYCRAESTYYIDWFATTSAGHKDMKDLEIIVRLQGQCPNCKPEVYIVGSSNLDTRARIRSANGGVSGSSSAKADASTVWAGPLACSDSCGSTVSDLLTGGETKLALAGFEVSGKHTRSEVYESTTAGQADQDTIYGPYVRLEITNKGEVRTYAAGAQDNCQAKVLAGESVLIMAKSACGAVGKYELKIVAR